jgi:ABC-type nitrate/sulfonate/bicarbonate transport system substrate-binding protein
MKKLSLLFLIFTLLLFCLTSCAKKQQEVPLQKVTVTLDWTPNTNHTGLYVAQEKNYYKQEGLDVQIVQPGEGITLQIVGAGKSEFGISYQEDVTTARSKNIPVVSIAAIIQHNTSGFASLEKANIKSPKDFQGKRYGDWGSPTATEIIRALVEKDKGNFSKVTVISGITDFFHTIGKDADFEWIYYGWDGVEARRRGMDINIMMLKDLDPVFDYYTPVIVTNESTVINNPGLIKRFMKATAKGYAFAIQNPGQAGEILLKYAPELNPELVKASQEYLSTQYQADAKQWGFQKLNVWKDYTQWMYNHRLITEMIDVNKAYTNQFLPQR